MGRPRLRPVAPGVGPPPAVTQCQKLKLGEATGYSRKSMYPLAVRFPLTVLAGPDADRFL